MKMKENETASDDGTRHTPNLCDIDSARALRLDRNNAVPVTGIEGCKFEYRIVNYQLIVWPARLPLPSG